MLDSLFQSFDNIIVLDTETTGFSPMKEEIIELAMLRVEKAGAGFQISREYDEFIRLSPGKELPPKITELTGISRKMLDTQGIAKEQACAGLSEMLMCSRPLVVAYNAQFDLCFLYYFLRRFGKAPVLGSIKMLDALTVYKDRRPYPHKLCDAIDAYGLKGQNTHRAIDDTRATFELLCAMGEERDDLDRYINLFGYNPRFGAPRPKIGSVKYLPQGYEPRAPLYEQTQAAIF